MKNHYPLMVLFYSYTYGQEFPRQVRLCLALLSVRIAVFNVCTKTENKEPRTEDNNVVPAVSGHDPRRAEDVIGSRPEANASARNEWETRYKPGKIHFWIVRVGGRGRDL